MVTRDEARQVASAHLRQQGRETPIRAVLAWNEITARKPTVYTPRPIRWEDCWVCYLELTALMLASSEIVVVARETGEVVYGGSANDEG